MKELSDRRSSIHFADPRVRRVYLAHCLVPHPKPTLRYGFDLSPRKSGARLRKGALRPGKQPQAAAAIDFRNPSISACRLAVESDNCFADDSNWLDAAPVWLAPWLTSAMVPATWVVPAAVRWMLPEISCVAAPCCSIAAEIAVVISEILPMVDEIILIDPTASWVAVCMPAIWMPISSVAFAVCAASALTSCATTANPRPASPARAASIVALSASRLVCSATEVISLITSPMRLAACDSALMRESVSSAWRTALAAIELDSCTCWEISRTEIASSSVAEATDWTLLDASSEALATTVASRVVLPALSLSARAVPSSSLEADDSEVMMARKRLLASVMASLRSARLEPK